MTPAGWLILLASVGSITLWCGYCVYRVLTLPPKSNELQTSDRLGGEGTSR